MQVQYCKGLNSTHLQNPFWQWLLTLDLMAGLNHQGTNTIDNYVL